MSTKMGLSPPMQVGQRVIDIPKSVHVSVRSGDLGWVVGARVAHLYGRIYSRTRTRIQGKFFDTDTVREKPYLNPEGSQRLLAVWKIMSGAVF